MFPAGCSVLAAVSGGADSMCLLHLLKALGEERGFSVAAAHYNHMHRGEESLRDERFVLDWCHTNGIPCVTGRADVAAEARRLGLGFEETARRMRYAFLHRTAGDLGCDRVATAHTADDNVETLLLHLVRGTGLQGMAGIAPRRGDLVRPLLTTQKSELLAYLDVHGVPHIEDSTNAEPVHTRNRIRNEVIPALKELNPRLVEHLTDTIRYLRADNDYLNAQVSETLLHARWAEDNLVIEARYVAQLPAAVAPRAARRLLELMGDGDTNVSAAHLNAIVDICRGDDPSALVFLPNGLLAQRVYKELLLTTQADPPGPFDPVSLSLDGVTEAVGWRVECRPCVCPAEARHSAYRFYLSESALSAGAVLRPRRKLDEISLPKRGTKTIKKLFIDEKIPRQEREQIPLLCDEAGVIAVAGFGPDRSRLAQAGEAAYELTFTNLDG